VLTSFAAVVTLAASLLPLPAIAATIEVVIVSAARLKRVGVGMRVSACRRGIPNGQAVPNEW
jgi:hypothetical protein